MANFLINSAAVSVTGTEEKDTFQLASGASAVSVLGLGADDTIEFSAIDRLVSNSVFQANDGDDTISVDGTGGLSNSSVGGSLGKDTITFGDIGGNGSLNTVTVNGGQGADTLAFLADLSGTASALSINGGVADDTISIVDAGGTTIKASLIAGGRDDDQVITTGGDANYIGTTINGGLGEDDILISAGVISASTINGGSNGVEDSESDSADTIFVEADTLNKSTILGNGGDDTITVSAGAGTGTSIGGGQGIDTISFSGSVSSFTVGGGKGNDIITADQAGMNDSSVIGGDGEDAITILGSAISGDVTIQGGSQADTITLANGFTAGGVASFSYASFADSTLSDLDRVDLAFNESAGTVNSLVAAGVGVRQTTAVVGTNTVTVTAGYIETFSGTTIDAGLTAAVQFLDEALATNEAVAFTLSAGASDVYLFVQGGETDLLVNYDNIDETAVTLTAQSLAGQSKLIMGLAG